MLVYKGFEKFELFHQGEWLFLFFLFLKPLLYLTGGF